MAQADPHDGCDQPQIRRLEDGGGHDVRDRVLGQPEINDRQHRVQRHRDASVHERWPHKAAAGQEHPDHRKVEQAPHAVHDERGQLRVAAVQRVDEDVVPPKDEQHERAQQEIAWRCLPARDPRQQAAPTRRRPGRIRQSVRAQCRSPADWVGLEALRAVVDHLAAEVVGHEAAPPGEGISCATCANWGTPSPLARSYPGLA